ncbi:hypothetical protein SDC9_102703 [bioreactor metagenome]|uniref:Glycosyltransferase 2-like domain-containing protein n=1 Tax=bioreactor metagenome TaxID=1076179 RepID=A0A645ARJ9_9ZZZZ|nr:hypothetical protein [Erysipelotrichaceae bacterium]
MFAPLVLFVYNRLEHTKKTILALSQNTIAKKTCLYIYSDAAKNPDSEAKVNRVREYIHSREIEESFMSVTIIEAQQNKGLANSIIEGVSSIISKYKRVIVIEDDNISSKDFLQFMNDCLNKYETNTKIWSIGGFSCVDKFPADYVDDVYIVGRTCSYAWATWENRWNKVDWSVQNYRTSFRFNLPKRILFNKFGNDRSNMLDLQMHSRVNSWAIRFCYAEFEYRMYTVYPKVSRISNIGHDGSGTHFNRKTSEDDERFNIPLSSINNSYVLPNTIEINDDVCRNFAQHFNEPVWKCFRRYIGSFFKYGI